MNENKSSIGRRTRLGLVILLYVSASTVVLLPLILFAGIMFVSVFSSDLNRREVTDPGSDFTQITGFEWPASASVVSAGEVRLDFLGDGEFYLIFDADRATLGQWLAEAPPWGQEEWIQGPVSKDFGHGGFGITGMGADPIGGGPDKKLSKFQLEHVLGSDQVWYVAKKNNRESNWNNGNLLVIDLEHNRVWLSSWDL